jgi:phenylacetate-CoA ligase
VQGRSFGQEVPEPERKAQMTDWLDIYHRLPYSLRVLAASAKGYSLRFRRYGPETERLIREALDRDSWSSERWRIWREERLAHILHRAVTEVPYYREHWARRRREGSKASWETLDNWPILTKDTLRKDPKAFVAEGCDIRKMTRVHTSGTTGKPLSLWRSRETDRAWYALYGVSRTDRFAVLGGQLVAPFIQTRPPFWVWNEGLHQLYMSSYHLAQDFIPHYIDAIHFHKVTYLEGYPSSMYSLARFSLERGIDPPEFRVALSYAEPLFQYQSEAIARAFRCPVRNTYGMAEIACAASECREGVLHLWPEVGMVEVLRPDTDELVPEGSEGRMVCTGLLNADMPLIRYEIGDYGMIAPPRGICDCGRSLPILGSIEGRLDDVILTKDGRRIGRLDPVFKADLPVLEAQIIQEDLTRIRVRLVPSEGYDQKCGSTIMERLKDRVGDIEIILETVDSIPRSANGKFRAIVNNMNPSLLHNQTT